MKQSFRMLASLAAVSAAACVSSVALAQEPPAGPPPPAPGMDPGMDHGAWEARMHERAEARAKALRDVLNLRPDQEAAFQALQAAMKPPESMRDHRGDQAEMAGLTTPDRLDRMAARMNERQAAFQRRATAIKQFYAVLSPAQQHAFDALPDLMGDGRRGPGGPGGPGGPDRGEGPHGAS